jgi:hypothetical protein
MLPLKSHIFKRIFALAITALSCILLTITIVFWARSHGQYDRMGINDQMHGYDFTACRGTFYFAYTRTHEISLQTTSQPGTATIVLTPYTTTRRWFAYAYRSEPDRYPYALPLQTWGLVDASNIETTSNTTVPVGTALAIPAYAFAFLFTLTALLSFHLYRKNRYPLTHCQSCGYNLSGNPAALTCPECGKATPILKT